MNGNYKYLFKNIGVLTISNFTSKILTFLLVPLYTNILTPEEYGTYDFYVVTALLLIPLLSANIVEAILRFLLDKSIHPKDVFSIGLRFELLAIVLCSIIISINYKLELIEILNDYPIIFVIYFSAILFSDFMNQFARGMDKIKDVAVAGVINSITHIGLNILFLVYLKLGLCGFFYASIYSLIISGIYLFIKLKGWQYIQFFRIDGFLCKEMLAYSSPLIASNLSGWVNNLSSRFILVWLCGASINGVFSAATKIPAVLLVFQTIFTQAWTLSAVKSLGEKNSEFYKSVYQNYNFWIVLLCSLIILLDKPFSAILFGKAFYEAWQFAPFLLISVVFSSLTGFLIGVFSAYKRSKEIAVTMTIGAVINCVLCALLIHLIGPIGAAIASVLSYLCIWILQVHRISDVVNFKHYMFHDSFSYLILLVQAVTLLFIKNNVILYCLELFCLFMIIVSNKELIKKYYHKIRNK